MYASTNSSSKKTEVPNVNCPISDSSLLHVAALYLYCQFMGLTVPELLAQG